MRTKILIAYQNDPGIYHPYIEKSLIPCVFIGEIYCLCEALATKDREALVLDVIFSNKKETHNGYVEMHKVSQDTRNVCYTVVGLDGYRGEQDFAGRSQNPSILLHFFTKVCKMSVPGHIYFKIAQTIKEHIPLNYNKGFSHYYGLE